MMENQWQKYKLHLEKRKNIRSAILSWRYKR